MRFRDCIRTILASFYMVLRITGGYFPAMIHSPGFCTARIRAFLCVSRSITHSSIPLKLVACCGNWTSFKYFIAIWTKSLFFTCRCTRSGRILSPCCIKMLTLGRRRICNIFIILILISGFILWCRQRRRHQAENHHQRQEKRRYTFFP